MLLHMLVALAFIPEHNQIKMTRTRIAVILCLLAVLYACDCTSQKDVLNGVLEVPENRKDPNSRTLKLVYKVLKAKKADPSKAPIVYLQGGSGVATVAIMEELKKHKAMTYQLPLPGGRVCSVGGSLFIPSAYNAVASILFQMF